MLAPGHIRVERTHAHTNTHIAKAEKACVDVPAPGSEDLSAAYRQSVPAAARRESYCGPSAIAI
eukprot:38604-Eustigmatos_ZCMA.PRE.1